MTEHLRYPIIACGYTVDLHYLLDFLQMECDEYMVDTYTAKKLDWWYFEHLPRDQRASYPEPVRLTFADHTWDKVMVMLCTRFEVIKTEEAIDERLLEMDIDREKRDNFITSFARTFGRDPSALKFDLSTLKFDMKPHSPGPLGEPVEPR